MAGDRVPTMDRAALLVLVAQDLCTGPAAPVVDTERRPLISAITTVLSSSTWAEMIRHSAETGGLVEAWRASWILDEIHRNDLPDRRFSIRIARGDPSGESNPRVETRIMVDGMPLVARLFDKGPAEGPEVLLQGGQLRATLAEKEIRLAEAYCTEGCCGALRATMVREGPVVVWKNWRTSKPGDPSPELRFDAVEYDAEIARAEADFSWEWPARTVARLVIGQLRSDPGLLGRWDCRIGWCTAWLKELDLVRLTFNHPAAPVTADTPISSSAWSSRSATGHRNTSPPRSSTSCEPRIRRTWPR